MGVGRDHQLEWEFDDEAMRTVELSLHHYLDQLLAGYFDNETDSFDNTESGIPFCGCTTCIAREMLAWLVPRIGTLVEKGKLWRAS